MRYLALLLIPVLVMVGCATTAPRNATAKDLIGSWESIEKGGTEADRSPFVGGTISFDDDAVFTAHLVRGDGSTMDLVGTFEMDSPVVTYYFDGGDTEQFTATMTGRTLRLRDNSMDMWMTFRPQ